jgi:hypothetical protein
LVSCFNTPQQFYSFFLPPFFNILAREELIRAVSLGKKKREKNKKNNTRSLYTQRRRGDDLNIPQENIRK